VTVNCLHPGFVKTDIGNKDTQWYSKLFWTLSSKLAGISVESGAKTSVYLASSDAVKGVTGKYFDKCKEKEPAPLAKDEQLQKDLWNISALFCPIA
jgi:NAD(P)-dependent dehydrogenase (short-subunit alcohol dehydrogenase family)